MHLNAPSPPGFARRELLMAAAGAAASPTTGRAAPPASISEETFHDRHALVLQNDRMRVAVLPGGGFIAEARLKSADPRLGVNPMRIPHYPTIDPYAYDPARHGALYGTGIQRRLMSGYMGHFTCFPQFAASSPAEFAQDYGQHGELIAVKWRRAPAAGPELVMTAELPITQFAFERRIALPPGETVAYVTETAENLVRYDRPVQWVQHTAFGPPFAAVGSLFADASVECVAAPGGGRGPWGAEHRAFTGRTALWLASRDAAKGWITLYSREFNLLIGYVFDAAGNPWMLDYQEDRSVAEKPWDNRVVMRGVCFGDSATPGVRNAVTQGSVLGRPTYSWFEARGRRTRRYAIFLAEIPPGFQGVERLSAEGGAISLVERETGRRLSIKASQLR
jgi:hypothetical protein